jgi:hypothetical protein
VAIDPAQFERHPVGADIAFIEDMDRHASLAAQANRGRMMIAAIAEQHHVGDPLLGEQAREEGGPLRQRAAILDPARQAPERAVPPLKLTL